MGSKARCKKRGVDGADGAEAARGHAGGKDHGVLFGDAHIEVALGMMRPEEIEAGAVGHGGGDGHDALVLVGQLDERVGEDLGVGELADRLGLAGFGIVGPEAVKFLLPVERRLEAAALLREHVQQDRVVFGLEELEGLDQQRKVVAVDGAEVLQAELLKEDGGPQHALGGLFGAAHHLDGGLAADALDNARGRVVQVLVVLVGDDAVEVAGDGADVAVDGPLVVVEHDDHALGLLGDVVERLERDAVGEGGVAGHGDHVLVCRRPDRAPRPCPARRRARCRRGRRRSSRARSRCAA